MVRAQLAKDRYRFSRGGHSRVLEISCEKCLEILAYYQKDGPGELKRMYIDRLLKSKNIKVSKETICKKCGHVLGMKTIYEKENRLCIRLFQNSVNKKVVSLKNIQLV